MVDSADQVDAKQLNRAQFGANAGNYATSVVHAKGASLGRMVELCHPQADWIGLDIATAAGHTAMAFAPHVAVIVASDLTIEMVALARDRGIELDQANLRVAQSDAEHLAFAANSFDLVTCRIAPHHFPDPGAFVTDVARVLRPNGVFALVDNTVPDDDSAARWYNDWELRRDPSHVRCLAVSEWEALIVGSGLRVEASETAPKQMRFKTWVDNMSVPADVRPGLLGDLLGAPPVVRDFLQPSGIDQENAGFVLTEALIIARKIS